MAAILHFAKWPPFWAPMMKVITFIMGALGAWMFSNRLRLNSTKTQFIWLGTRQQLQARLGMAALSVAFPLLTFSSPVRDLGVTLDCELTFATHINLLSRDRFHLDIFHHSFQIGNECIR